MLSPEYSSGPMCTAPEPFGEYSCVSVLFGVLSQTGFRPYSFVSGFGTLQQGSEPGREPGSEHGNPEPAQNEPGTPQDSDLTIKHVLSMIYLITVQLSRRLNSTADQNFGLVAGLAAGFASGFDVRVRTRPAQRSMLQSAKLWEGSSCRY